MSIGVPIVILTFQKRHAINIAMETPTRINVYCRILDFYMSARSDVKEWTFCRIFSPLKLCIWKMAKKYRQFSTRESKIVYAEFGIKAYTF